MKKSPVSKSVTIFLFIALTLQLTGITCFGEEHSLKIPMQQWQSQLKDADSGRGVDASTHEDIIGHCQCPCHLAFIQAQLLTVTNYHVSRLSLIQPYKLSVKKIPSYIFQPPKLFL